MCLLLPQDYSQRLFNTVIRIHPIFYLFCHKNTPNFCFYCQRNTLRFVSFTSTRIHPFIFFTAIRIHSVLCPLLPQEYSQYFFFTPRYLFFITTRIHPIFVLYCHKNTLSYMSFITTRIHPFFSLLPKEYTPFCILYYHKDTANICLLLP